MPIAFGGRGGMNEAARDGAMESSLSALDKERMLSEQRRHRRGASSGQGAPLSEMGARDPGGPSPSHLRPGGVGHARQGGEMMGSAPAGAQLTIRLPGRGARDEEEAGEEVSGASPEGTRRGAKRPRVWGGGGGRGGGGGGGVDVGSARAAGGIAPGPGSLSAAAQMMPLVGGARNDGGPHGRGEDRDGDGGNEAVV